MTIADREVSMPVSHHNSAALGAGKASTELGVPCSTSAVKRRDETLPYGSTHDSRAAEVPPDMRQNQATGSGRASGDHYENGAQPSTDMRPFVAGSSHRSGDHSHAEQGGKQIAGTSPDEDLCMTRRAAWQPYLRKAGVQSMDLDAICMPRR